MNDDGLLDLLSHYRTQETGIGACDTEACVLPVVECQNPGDLCSAGSLDLVTGALCFEIREIRLFPDRIIAGRFLCPERDPVLFAECELGPLFTD